MNKQKQVMDLTAVILIDVTGKKRSFVTDDGGVEFHVEGLVDQFGKEVYGELNTWEVESFCEDYGISYYSYNGTIELTEQK